MLCCNDWRQEAVEYWYSDSVLKFCWVLSGNTLGTFPGVFVLAQHNLTEVEGIRKMVCSASMEITFGGNASGIILRAICRSCT